MAFNDLGDQDSPSRPFRKASATTADRGHYMALQCNATNTNTSEKMQHDFQLLFLQLWVRLTASAFDVCDVPSQPPSCRARDLGMEWPYTTPFHLCRDILTPIRQIVMFVLRGVRQRHNFRFGECRNSSTKPHSRDSACGCKEFISHLSLAKLSLPTMRKKGI